MSNQDDVVIRAYDKIPSYVKEYMNENYEGFSINHNIKNILFLLKSQFLPTKDSTIYILYKNPTKPNTHFGVLNSITYDDLGQNVTLKIIEIIINKPSLLPSFLTNGKKSPLETKEFILSSQDNVLLCPVIKINNDGSQPTIVQKRSILMLQTDIGGTKRKKRKTIKKRKRRTRKRLLSRKDRAPRRGPMPRLFK